MKFRLIASILGLIMAMSGAAVAQSGDDQALDQDSKPSPNIQMQGPSDQMQGPNDQGSMNQGPMDSDSNDQDSVTQSSSAPEENRGVARVSLIHGDVSTQRGDNSTWSAAALNAPVLAGDRVSTGDRARTELQLDYANMLRLAEHSQANITSLTRSQIQIQLARGMANYTVLKNSDADAEIDTPNVAIRTNRGESSFRILVTADDHTEVLVRRGEVEVTTPQGGTRVTQGQFITIQGAGDQEQYKIGAAPARDDWDQWNTDRDNLIRNSASRRHTNDYYVGTEDLDAHGTWSEVPDYGPVWRPTVTDPDWAPYRNGHWVYEPYWGWTWVSYDDWGWAPYHYGRWMYLDGGWGWWPGPVYGYPFYRPIWAPAYVSFFGWGGGFGFGFGGGFGSVGWLPLGPCDHFHPWWGRWGGRFGNRDIRGFNRGGFAPLHGGQRFSNVNLAMHDQHFRGGTTVSGNEFGRGRMNPRAISHAQFQNARFTTGRLPVTPGRESFSASGRPAAPSTIRNGSQNQRFFSARGNNSTQSRSFNREQSQMPNTSRQQGGSMAGRSNVARPPDNGFRSARGNDSTPSRSFNRGQSQIPNTNRQQGGSMGGRSDVARPADNGFRRFGQSGPNNVAPSRSNSPMSNSRPDSRGSSDWRSAPRPGNTVNSSPSRDSGNSNRGSWQRFTPMPQRPFSGPARSSGPARPSEPSGRPSMGGPESRGSYGSYGSPRSAAPENRGSYGSYGSPRSAAPDSRGYGSQGRGYSGGYSRPPLNMRQPIVTTPRSSGRGYSGAPSGGNRGGYSGGGSVRQAPSYGGGGGRSAPSNDGGGGRSAPSGGGSPHGGGGSPHGGGGGGSRHGR